MMRVDRRWMVFHYFHNSVVQFAKIVQELRHWRKHNEKRVNNKQCHGEHRKRATET